MRKVWPPAMRSRVISRVFAITVMSTRRVQQIASTVICLPAINTASRCLYELKFLVVGCGGGYGGRKDGRERGHWVRNKGGREGGRVERSQLGDYAGLSLSLLPFSPCVAQDVGSWETLARPDCFAGRRRRRARRGGGVGEQQPARCAIVGRPAAATFVREFYTTNWIIDSYEIMVLVFHYGVLGVRECVRAGSLACMCLEVRVRV